MRERGTKVFRLSITYVIIGIWQYITTASFLLEKEKKAKQASKQTNKQKTLGRAKAKAV